MGRLCPSDQRNQRSVRRNALALTLALKHPPEIHRTLQHRADATHGSAESRRRAGDIAGPMGLGPILGQGPVYG
jgi:hypothetical protein